ncbi:hypothetical protein BD779DRAFT_1444806 [Infundibulicybe gibba]|nr:hypothetical protein BD779DRAFT_1444806 [Infundibulicybe gibba]
MSTHWYPDGYNYPSVFHPPSQVASSSSGRTPNTAYSPPTTRGPHGYYPRSPHFPRALQHQASRAPVLNQHPDLIDGIDYFKIGETVRVRRYHAQKDEYTSWLTGKVERPVLVPDALGGTKRSYIVSYTNPHTGISQEKMFSPFLNEISEVPVPQMVSMPRVSEQRLVFALVPAMAKDGNPSHHQVWTPSLLLTRPTDRGARVRIMAGPAKNKEINNVKFITTYSPQHATDLRRRGAEVIGDGRREY